MSTGPEPKQSIRTARTLCARPVARWKPTAPKRKNANGSKGKGVGTNLFLIVKSLENKIKLQI